MKTRSRPSLLKSGLSIVELMIVVAILSGLVTMSVTKLNQHRLRARQAEVRVTLTHIYNLERVYFLDRLRYAPVSSDFSAAPYNSLLRYGFTGFAGGTHNCTLASNFLGEIMRDCSSARYGYWVDGDANGFMARAGSGCTFNEERYQMDHNKDFLRTDAGVETTLCN